VKIKVLGINASPRKGNSEFLLNKALDYIKQQKEIDVEIEKYSFRGKKIQPCLACNYCSDHNGKCIQNDDFNSLKEMWVAADVILYSVPVYHMGMPGQLKCFIDRLGNSLFGTFSENFPAGAGTLPKLYKVIGNIVQGIHFSSGQEHTITQLINHTLLMQSIPVVADMWESYIGSAGWTENNINRKALEEMYNKGSFDATIAVKSAEKISHRAIELALIIKSGLRSNKEYFQKQNHYNVLMNKISD